MTRRQRILAAALATLAVGNLAVGGVVVGSHFAHQAGHTATARHDAHFRGLPDQSEGGDAARTRAISALLASRAAAIVHHDRAAFVATLDPRSPQFRAKQLTYFANLQPVPFASWSYTVDPANTAPTDGSQFLRYRAPVWLPHVVLHYEIRGFDRSPTASDVYYTFVQRGSHWYVASDNDDADLAYDTARDIWDFGPVAVVAGARALVLGHPDSAVSLRTLAAEADRDIPRVIRVWGRRWSQRVVVIAPNTQGELGHLLANAGDLSRIAAVATAELVEGSHQPTAVGDRVLINPHNYLRLNAKGRQVVVTHEITHVASRRASGPLLPTWLIEGLADYVGYREINVTPAIAAQELKAFLDSGHRLGALPSDATYDGSNKHLDRAYDESWLACRFIAEHWSPATLVRLYETVGATNHGTAAAATNNAMRVVLHEPLSTFTEQWHSYVASVLQ